MVDCWCFNAEDMKVWYIVEDLQRGGHTHQAAEALTPLSDYDRS